MKDRKLALRYARALLGVFPDPGQAESTDQFLTSLGQAVSRSAEFRRVMLDPAFSKEVRLKALAALAERAGLPQTVRNFLKTLVRNNRTAALPSIAAVFHEEREKAMGVVAAEIATATPLADDLRQRAGQAVEKLTGRRVRLTCKVEPELIGGAVTRIGSMVYDGSIRTQLEQMRSKMNQE